MTTGAGSSNGDAPERQKRTRIVRPYPTHTLEEVLKVPAAIQESSAGLPIDPQSLAEALGTTTRSSGFIMRLNSSLKYGLTQGVHNDARISVTPLGQAVVSPKDDEELGRALVQAARRPEMFERFYAMLDGKHLPQDRFAENLLQRDLRVDPRLSSECLGIIKANGLYTGLLRQVEGALHVDLSGLSAAAPRSDAGTEAVVDEAGAWSDEVVDAAARIFVSHDPDSATEALEHVRRVLWEFGLSHAEAEAGADGRPVPAQVSETMRWCTAAIVVVGAAGGWHGVRYQLGAASALYGDRVVVVTEAGLSSPDKGLTLSSVAFERERADEFGLALLRALREAGVLRVTLCFT